MVGTLWARTEAERALWESYFKHGKASSNPSGPTDAAQEVVRRCSEAGDRCRELLEGLHTDLPVVPEDEWNTTGAQAQFHAPSPGSTGYGGSWLARAPAGFKETRDLLLREAVRRCTATEARLSAALERISAESKHSPEGLDANHEENIRVLREAMSQCCAAEARCMEALQDQRMRRSQQSRWSGFNDTHGSVLREATHTGYSTARTWRGRHRGRSLVFREPNQC